jgi:hypothetical protein
LHKISKAPAPIGSLPIGHAVPEQDPKPKFKRLPKALQKRKRGPKPKVVKGLEDAIRNDLRNGRITRDEKIIALAERYKAKYASTREAYNNVLSESEFVENSNSDK